MVVALAVGGDLRLHPVVDGHGFALVHWDQPVGRVHLVTSYDTDTLRLSVEQLRLGRVELGAMAAGEVYIAGLLSDYYQRGRLVPERGFYASYAALSAWAKLLAAPHYLELAVTARRWFFQATSDTRRGFVLPADAWVGELRLRYTLWQLAPDRSLWEAHRPFPRVRGVAFGVEAGVDLRDDAHKWGDDARNDPSSTIVMLRQWLRAGANLVRGLRLQLDETAVWMFGEDDLVRARLGGMNRYTLPLAGAVWPAYLAGRVASAELSLHARIAGEVEAGLLADGAIVDDRDRTGSSPPGALFGVGIFADVRVGAWQFDFRGGWSPTERGGVSALASVGWSR
jgi:hypothetical protein